MEKYKLAKDLPFAIKGDEVRYNSEKGFYEVKSSTYHNNWFPFAPAVRSTLIEAGWIEEVREPREFYLYLDLNGMPITAYKGEPTPMYSQPERCIKVREVID